MLIFHFIEILIFCYFITPVTMQLNKLSRIKQDLKYPNTNEIRRQAVFPYSMTFPCNFGGEGKVLLLKEDYSFSPNFANLKRSAQTPVSVHRLRPGDIDVIGAMGDSLIAGSGALEEFALGTFIEYRGVSWCAGGEGTWHQYLTLPNILKEFNPNLTGYSTGTGELLSSKSRLNVAFPVSATEDALMQAKVLVNKMKKDPLINMKDNWKLITIFFGANDLCSAQCFKKDKYSASEHAKMLMVALDYLQENLPRTFVNLIPVLDPSVSLRVKRTLMCRFLHRLFCACFHKGTEEEAIQTITGMTLEYQSAMEELISSGRYDNSDNFTVVLQPFMKSFNIPKDPEKAKADVIDASYITHDCFHFSQKGHALTANLLWNNMLQPVGYKSTSNMSYIMESFLCPSENAPYLFTNRNSKTYLTSGRQW